MGHRIGTLLLVIGVGVLAWAATVYFWKDPFTTAYTAYEQRQLASNLDAQFDRWGPHREPVSQSGEPTKRDDVSREAKRYRLASKDGGAIARIRSPRLDVNLRVVKRT